MLYIGRRLGTWQVGAAGLLPPGGRLMPEPDSMTMRTGQQWQRVHQKAIWPLL